jgi:hypothetical protein
MAPQEEAKYFQTTLLASLETTTKLVAPRPGLEEKVTGKQCIEGDNFVGAEMNVMNH